MNRFFNSCKRFGANIDKAFNRATDFVLTFFRKNYYWLAFVLILFVSLVVRLAFLDYLSGDMNGALLPWFNFLKTNGGFSALKTYPWTNSGIAKAGDYPVAYINLLAFLSYLPIKGIVSIKLSSIFFDYALAIGAVLLIRMFNKNWFFSLISFTILVFFPTSILNSALWGQADQMYVGLVVWTLYLLLKNKQGFAMFILGFAIAVKLQTTFFLPVLVFMWLNKKFKLRNLFFMIFAIFLTFVPSYLAGSSLTMPFEMYKLQVSGLYKNANYGAGSIYAFFESTKYRDGINDGAGLAFAFIIIGIALLVLFHYKTPATKKNIVFVSVLFSILVPFVLPHMHERYFYMADVFLILYVLIYRRKYILGVLMSVSSVLAYTHFLTGSYIFTFLGQDSVRLAAIINFVIIVTLIYDAKNVLDKPHIDKSISDLS